MVRHGSFFAFLRFLRYHQKRVPSWDAFFVRGGVLQKSEKILYISEGVRKGVPSA